MKHLVLGPKHDVTQQTNSYISKLLLSDLYAMLLYLFKNGFSQSQLNLLLKLGC